MNQVPKCQDRDSGRPQLSIIIVIYNGRRYLKPCLDALKDQVGDGAEVIVVDNASTDNSDDLVAAQFPCVRLMRNETNRGFAAACNQGARVASGEILVFLNQDTKVKEGWLIGLVGPLAEPSIGLTTSKVLQMSHPDRIHLAGQDVHYTGLVFGRGFQAPAVGLASADVINAVGGASFAIRRALWEALGGFDEAFFMYYEETDLSWRAQLWGYHCHYAPASVVLHDYRDRGPSYNELYHSMRNRVLMTLKNWRWPTLLLLAPGLLLTEGIDWFLACHYGRKGLRAKLRAVGWLATHPRLIVRGHRLAQGQRSVSDAEILKSRAHRVAPVTVTGGTPGKRMIGLCEALFEVNHRLACKVCDVLAL